MFKYLSKFAKTIQDSGAQTANHSPKTGKGNSAQNLYPELAKNLDNLRAVLGASDDVIIREFSLGPRGNIDAALIFIEGMIDKNTVDENILKPLMYNKQFQSPGDSSHLNDIENLMKRAVSVREAQRVSSAGKVISGILCGDTVLFVDGSSKALVLSTKGWESRAVEEPNTETVVRGPREGFTENFRTNTALLRRKIQNPNLIIETIQSGEKTKTKIGLAYIRGIVNPELIKELKRRLDRIKIDAVLESGYIEQLIEDAPLSPFATVGNSEKPDVVAGKIMEGRAAVLVDGTPMVLTLPRLFVENFQSSEDYYSRPYYSSLIRLVRYISFLISILAPASYVALSTFHQELIPTPLLITMAAATEGTPFPAIMEALGMGVIFEILREAGIRLPRPVGQAVSIVGALVIGEVAVVAGIVGAPMVIVIALTAIASFVTPPLTDASAIIRIILVLLAGFIGAFGIVIGLIGVLIHLASIRSFGVPFLAPMAPMVPEELKDTYIRVPWWLMVTRPRSIGQHDPHRQNFRLMPRPSSDTEQ